jgi:hypothetical protein
MIRIQPTSSDSDRLLIGSDLADSDAACAEIDEWIKDNNCRVPETPRRLSVYEDGVLIREWMLVERCMENTDSDTDTIFHRLWQRRDKAAVNHNGACETIRLRFDKLDRAA